MSTQTEPRDINQLLALETYQGMTDAEIDDIIEYKAQLKFHSLESTQRQALEIERMNLDAARNDAAVQRTFEMLECMRGQISELRPVEPPKIIEFDSLGV